MDYDKLKINNKTLLDYLDEEVNSKEYSLSDLTNDAFVVKTDKIESVEHSNYTLKLSDCSVSPGNYGPSSDVTIGSTNTGSITIPYFTVNSQGIVTSVSNKTLSISNSCSNCSQCSKYSACSNCQQCSAYSCRTNHSRYSRCSQCSQSP